MKRRSFLASSAAATSALAFPAIVAAQSLEKPKVTIAVGGKTNEHKEALRLLGMLPLEGRVVTGDAMFTHRDVADEILKGGGDYLLSVKDNQPTLRKDIEAALHDERGFSPLPTRP